jgi:hypothetical protein
LSGGRWQTFWTAIGALAAIAAVAATILLRGPGASPPFPGRTTPGNVTHVGTQNSQQNNTDAALTPNRIHLPASEPTKPSENTIPAPNTARPISEKWRNIEGLWQVTTDSVPDPCFPSKRRFQFVGEQIASYRTESSLNQELTFDALYKYSIETDNRIVLSTRNPFSGFSVEMYRDRLIIAYGAGRWHSRCEYTRLGD